MVAARGADDLGPGERRIAAQRVGLLLAVDALHPGQLELLHLGQDGPLGTLVATQPSRYPELEGRHPAETAVAQAKLKQLAQRLTDVPPNFKVHPSVERLLAARREMGEGRQPLDWGMAENLAYASLVDEGHPVRLSGQDAAGSSRT